MASILLFGATGDLARRMLLPSLYGLDVDGWLEPSVRIIGSARSPLSKTDFQSEARQAIEPHRNGGLGNPDHMERFIDRLDYVALDAGNRDGFTRLADALKGDNDDVSIFLSTAPALFAAMIDGLRHAGLTGRNVRLALEKPLGSDLASSRAINDAVASAFPEERTFRIDHYLGKETVQNVLALRFANRLFEPLWTASTIEHVQITVAETVGLEGRVDFYDQAGAIRDMVQNHMLQLMALIAMEPPAKFDATAIRDEKVKVLRSLRPIDVNAVRSHVVTGQYAAGHQSGKLVQGYTEELGKASDTETFVAIKAHIDNWRWKGVPFYLRTGKRQPERRSEIVIQFKPVPHSIFDEVHVGVQPNKMVISLQPDENIGLTLMVKRPGLDQEGIRLQEVALDLGLANIFSDSRRRIAYERLLLDLIKGNSTLFVRRDEVEAQWAWIDALRESLAAAKIKPLLYAANTGGPSAVDDLLGRDGAKWHE